MAKSNPFHWKAVAYRGTLLFIYLLIHSELMHYTISKVFEKLNNSSKHSIGKVVPIQNRFAPV